MNLTIGSEINSFDNINHYSNSFEREEALEETLDFLQTTGYSFLAIPVVDPAYANHFKPGGSLADAALTPFSPSDLLVSTGIHCDKLVAKVSSWLSLDSTDKHERTRAEAIFNHELAWIGHLCVHQVLLTPTRSHNYARHVLHALNALQYSKILVRIPVHDWKLWNTIRTACDHSSRLSVALDLHTLFESDFSWQHWLAEPVKLVMLSPFSFVENASGYPVLPKRLKAFTSDLMKICRQFSIKQVLDSPHPKGGPEAYQKYLHHLASVQPAQDEMERFAAGYDDYLQMPLQPLMDNLDNGTYEVFEQDPIKYAQYEEAVRRALIDRGQETTVYVVYSRPFLQLTHFSIAVLGAGRGPLVHRCLLAAQAAQTRVHVYAVEKNVNAMVGLQKRMASEWQDAVTLVHGDMRQVDIPPVDMIVSELLGSFGDNELSPECLDGAQHLLKPNGISIPSSYTAWACPLSSSKLHTAAVAHRDLLHLETPYVVRFKQTNFIGQTLPVWTFEHPVHPSPPTNAKPNFNQHNHRWANLKFTAQESSLVHGLAGFFECVLYKDVLLSIHPPTHSPGMLSWFPIYFPIRTPMYVDEGDEIVVDFWRCSDPRKVWYEWMVTVCKPGFPTGNQSPIHNPAGRSYWIGL